jgi:hypothetical protein
MTSSEILHYLPEEVPDHLFTQSRLRHMGLTSIAVPVAYVVYPEQKTKYRLIITQPENVSDRGSFFSSENCNG